MAQEDETSLARLGERIPVVWLHDPDDTAHYWERDWLRFLLSGLPVQHHPATDTASAPLRNALVIFGNDIAQPEVRAYLDSYDAARCPHGLIHLSDEYFRHDISRYASATVVFRTCYRPEAPQNTFGLGYKQGFWDGYAGRSPADLTVGEREHLWSFIGDDKKSDRPRMMRAFRWIRPRFVHRTSYWNSPDYLPVTEYRDVLLRTVFVPSPRGTFSLDCFRTYETLEAGAIPIVMRQTEAQPFNYYQTLFGAMGFAEPVPFPQVSAWDEAAALVRRARKAPAETEQLRLRCHAWWGRYKEHTKAQFTERVRGAFHLPRHP